MSDCFRNELVDLLGSFVTNLASHLGRLFSGIQPKPDLQYIQTVLAVSLCALPQELCGSAHGDLA